MNFTKQEETNINEFLIKYNQDIEFKDDVERKYNEEIHALSILHIYALEEIIRFGKKNIYNNYIAFNDSETSFEFYDMFMNRLTHDKAFSESKLLHLENVSKVEAFIIYTFLKCIADKNNIQIKEKPIEELNYDPLNKISISTDEELYSTIKNTVLGANIHEMIEKLFPFLKRDQYRNGQFSKQSKSFLINVLSNTIPELKEEIEQKTKSLFMITKLTISVGGKDELLNIFNKYNTNISFDEIYGKDKDLKK